MAKVTSTWGELSFVKCECDHIADRHRGDGLCFECIAKKAEKPCAEFRRADQPHQSSKR